ncbi:hypothetical protein GGQ10_003169 [Salinibacter ruber]|nr:hypothetical protein [Salinibacter ruber]MCS4088322.1 hypothetical protein [Salinibacter ruber]MCS4176805.1 hypothetical protein [Salinibacter ruber]
MLYEFKIKVRSGPSRARLLIRTSPLPPIDWVGSCLGRPAALAPTPTPMNGRHLHWPKARWDGGPRSGPCRPARHCGHGGLGLNQRRGRGQERPRRHGIAARRGDDRTRRRGLMPRSQGQPDAAQVCSCRGGLRRTSPTACPSFTPPALPACLTGALPEAPPKAPGIPAPPAPVGTRAPGSGRCKPALVVPLVGRHRFIARVTPSASGSMLRSTRSSS